MTDLNSDLMSYAAGCIQSHNSMVNEFASAIILSTQCEISRLSSRICQFGNETLTWFHIDGALTLPPLSTEFHRKHGIPSKQNLLDYVVVSGFKDLDSAFTVTVQHRNSTPELREFFERVDLAESGADKQDWGQQK